MSAILWTGANFLLSDGNPSGIDLSKLVLRDDSRISLWGDTLNAFSQRPVLGFGLDSFGTVYGKFASINTTFYKADYAHNEYLQMLSDSGLPGLLSFLLILIAVWLYVSRKHSQRRSLHSRSIGAGAAAGCLAFLIHSFFDFNLRIPSNLFLFSFMLSIAIMSLATKTRREGLVIDFPRIESGSKKIRSLIFVAFVSVCALALLLWSYRADMADSIRKHSATLPAQKAVEELDKAVKLNPLNSHSYKESAVRHFEMRNYEKAKELLIKAQGLNRFDPYISYEASRVAKAMGETDTAVMQIERSVQNDGMNARWLKVSADYLMTSGDIPLAVARYQKALKLAPEYAGEVFKKYFSFSQDVLLAKSMLPEGSEYAAFELVRHLVLTEDYEEAIALFTQELAHVEKANSYYEVLTGLLLKKERYADVLKLLEDIPRPLKEAVLMRNYGLALYRSGEEDLGIKYLADSFRVNTSDNSSLDTLERILRKAGKLDKLKKILDGLSVEYRDNAHIHHLYSLYYTHEKNWYFALSEAKVAVSKNTLQPRYRQNLGHIYSLQGMYTDAIREWKNILDLDPKATWIKPHIGRAYEKMGKHEEAEKWMN